MLVLTRKPGEGIIIASLVEVTIIQTEDSLLKMQIDAPQSLSVARTEIYEYKEIDKTDEPLKKTKLSLTRRIGEGIIIGDIVKVTVVKKNDTLKLQIDAPREISIHRTEIYKETETVSGALTHFLNIRKDFFYKNY